MPDESDIVIRECASLEDFRQCVAVQQSVWGFEDKDLIPIRMFVVAHKIEGQILGAFEPSGRMVGFSLAIPALKGSLSYFHSHMVGVLAEYRGRGLGQRIKWEQRRDALARGIQRLEWTFDPLELKNAYLNLERLGAIARRYVVNQYGISSSPLHRGLPTDRLIAEWWLESPRVVALAHEAVAGPREICRKIAVPWDVAETGKEAKRAEVQLQLRSQFQEAFAAGLVAVGFERSNESGIYLMGPLPV